MNEEHKPDEAGTMSEVAPVIDYLLGSGQLDGFSFGDGKPQGEGNFWWRKALRVELKKQSDLVDQLRAQLKDAEDALRFYADEAAHTECSVMVTQLFYCTPMSNDKGQRAREVLEKWGKK